MSPLSRRRVNHWSPWGNDQSGVANYASHLVPALNQFVDLTVIHPTEVDPVLRTRRPIDVETPTLDDADVNLFHIGNHLTHHWMIGPLMRHGGIVVLHDWSVFDIFRPMFYRSWHLWTRELDYNGELDRDIGHRRAEQGFLMAHPMNRRVFDAADVIVVHTPWVRDVALAQFKNADVRYVPHGGQSWPSQPVDSQSSITVLGGIGRHKQVSAAIEAFARVGARHRDARLRIVGRGDDRTEIQHLRDLALQLKIDERVEWHLNVDRSTYLRLLGESLIVVTLRSDTAGEMSGVLVEAWGAGRVGVTSDQPQFREFDERYCRRVSLGNRGILELADIMADALANPQKFAADGELARSLIEGEYSFQTVATQYAAIVEELASRPKRDVTRGVNVYGSWGTASGLAESARRHARALLDAQQPVTLPHGFQLPSYDASLVPGCFARTSHHAHYGVNLITANINEFHEVDPLVLGSRVSRRWNIALWIYEFPDIPAVLVPRFATVDEIWALGTFSANTFARYFNGPIVRLPPVIEARPSTKEPLDVRRRYGLRPDAVVVLFSFDFNSGWARKNPLAVVRAFRDAVNEESGVNAQLVIKVSGVTADYRDLLIRELSAVDGVLIDEHLTNDEFGDLLHAIDVYCSLHRAEGFGLGLAEAMALGKLAVATNYSGNLDFMNVGNSLLVHCEMRPLSNEDVLHNPGMGTITTVGSPWAEPSHDDAVRALRQSFSAEVRDRLGSRAAVDLKNGYSAQAAIDVMKPRLATLGDELTRFHTQWPRL